MCTYIYFESYIKHIYVLRTSALHMGEGDIDLYIKTRWQIRRSIHKCRVRHLDIMHDARDGDNDDNQ